MSLKKNISFKYSYSTGQAEDVWIVDEGKLAKRQISYVPALYKIFDEILVNAADNKQRDEKNMNK